MRKQYEKLQLAFLQDTGDDISALPAVPLYTPPIESSPSLAAEMLSSQIEAAEEDVAQNAANAAWQESGLQGSMLPQQLGADINSGKLEDSQRGWV